MHNDGRGRRSRKSYCGSVSSRTAAVIRMRSVAAGAAALCALAGLPAVAAASPTRTLDGRGNNVRHPTWGQAGARYLRIAAPAYADGIGRMAPAPPARFISNRIFNDVGQNLFSENGVTQWGWVWGQFLDHDFGLRDERVIEIEPIGFSAADPLESFRERLQRDRLLAHSAGGRHGRDDAAAVRQPAEQLHRRVERLRHHPTAAGLAARRQGRRRPTDNAPTLLLDHGYLPRVGARGDPKKAPAEDLFGALDRGRRRARSSPATPRANGNVGLTAVHTLFAREHNRIVRLLPSKLSAEERFQIARRVVGAEEQYITYTEFLPALGVTLQPYRGYKPHRGRRPLERVRRGRLPGAQHDQRRPRRHRGPGRWSAAKLAAFASAGIEVASHDNLVTLDIPLVVAFGNPTLLERVGRRARFAGARHGA